METDPRHILIAGVGNVLLTDDGIGVHAVRELWNDPIPGATIVDIGTAILHGLHFLESAERVLVIDAAQGGRSPGTIYLYDTAEEKERPTMVSIHAMGLRQAMRLLPPGKAPPAITVLGVEPESLAYGLELSPRLQKALPRVVALARQTVAGWLTESLEEAACLAGM